MDTELKKLMENREKAKSIVRDITHRINLRKAALKREAAVPVPVPVTSKVTFPSKKSDAARDITPAPPPVELKPARRPLLNHRGEDVYDFDGNQLFEPDDAPDHVVHTSPFGRE